MEGPPGNRGSSKDQPGGGKPTTTRRANSLYSNRRGTRSTQGVSLKHAKRKDFSGRCDGESRRRRRRASPRVGLRGPGAGAPSREGGTTELFGGRAGRGGRHRPRHSGARRSRMLRDLLGPWRRTGARGFGGHRVPGQPQPTLGGALGGGRAVRGKLGPYGG